MASKTEKLARKENAIAQLRELLTADTVIYTKFSKRTDSSGYLVSSYIAKNNSIIRISHLVANALDMKLTTDQEFWTGRIGVDPYFGVAHLLRQLLFNKNLAYQAM